MKNHFIVYAVMAFILAFTGNIHAQDKKPELPKDSSLISFKKPLDLSKDKIAYGVFTEQQTDSKSNTSGLTIKGIVTKSPLVGEYEVNILWNEFVQGEKITKIEPPLQSKLRSKQSILPANKPFTFKGKKPDNLAAAVEQDRQLNKNKSEVDETVAESRTPQSSRASGSGQNTLRTGTGSTDSAEQQVPDIPTDSTNRISYESCENHIDIAQGYAFEQSREVTSDQSGKIISRGECSDTGNKTLLSIAALACEPERDGDYVYLTSKSIYSDNNREVHRSSCTRTGETKIVQTEFLESCGYTLNLASNTGYKRINEFATIDGQRLSLTNCISQTDVPLTLSTTYEGCSQVHDFVNNRTVQKQRYFYSENGANVYVTDCLDSELSYDHVRTGQGCTPIINQVSGKVTLMTQPSYLVDGQAFYPSSCTPSTTDTDLIREVCDPALQHDFSNNVSTELARYYYNDYSGNKTYATDCALSDTTFNHSEVVDDCSISFDVSNHSYTQQTKTAITYNSSVLYIDGCGSKTQAVTYPTSSTKTEAFGSELKGASAILSTATTFTRSELSPNPSLNTVRLNYSYTGRTYCQVTFSYQLNSGSVSTLHSASYVNQGAIDFNYTDTLTVTMNEGDTIQFYVHAEYRPQCTVFNDPYGSLVVTANWD